MSLRLRRFAPVGYTDGQYRPMPSVSRCSQARSRLVPDKPVHAVMLSSQPILGLPSTRPTITLPSMVSCGCLITCPKKRSLRDLTCLRISLSVLASDTPAQWSSVLSMVFLAAFDALVRDIYKFTATDSGQYSIPLPES